MEGQRLNITLDAVQAARLQRLAARMHVQEGTLARALLSTALEDSDVSARSLVELLDGLPGALDRAKAGLGQATAGETIAVDDL